MPEKLIVLTAAKPYIITFVMGFFASALRYSQDIKSGKKVTFMDFVSFNIVATAIVFTTLAFIQHVGFDLGFPAYMIIFWVGVASPFVYDTIVATVHKIVTSIAERLSRL